MSSSINSITRSPPSASRSGCSPTISRTSCPCHDANRAKLCPMMRVIARITSSSMPPIDASRRTSRSAARSASVKARRSSSSTVANPRARHSARTSSRPRPDCSAISSLVNFRPLPSSTSSTRSTSRATSVSAGDARRPASRPRSSGRVDDQHVDTRVPHHVQRHRAEEPPGESVQPDIADDQQVGADLADELLQALARPALDRSGLDRWRRPWPARGRAPCAACPRPGPTRRPGRRRGRARPGRRRRPCRGGRSRHRR